MPMLAEELFARLRAGGPAQGGAKAPSWRVDVSVIEIYNERVRLPVPRRSSCDLAACACAPRVSRSRRGAPARARLAPHGCAQPNR